MSKTTIDGIKAKHAIVTPTCRKNKTITPAGLEAAERLVKEYDELARLPTNADAEFHFVLTVQRPQPTEPT